MVTNPGSLLLVGNPNTHDSYTTYQDSSTPSKDYSTTLPSSQEYATSLGLKNYSTTLPSSQEYATYLESSKDFTTE